MERLLRAEERVGRVSDMVAWVAMAGLLLQSIIILVDVLGRYLFNRPIIGLQDITGLLVVVVVAASLPACLANRGNIRIDMVGKLFGPRVERAFNAFGALCLLVFVALLAWQVLVYATEINSYGERTWVLRLPTAPAFFAAGLFLAVCVPIQIFCTVVDIFRVFAADGAEAPSRSHSH